MDTTPTPSTKAGESRGLGELSSCAQHTVIDLAPLPRALIGIRGGRGRGGGRGHCRGGVVVGVLVPVRFAVGSRVLADSSMAAVAIAIALHVFFSCFTMLGFGGWRRLPLDPQVTQWTCSSWIIRGKACGNLQETRADRGHGRSEGSRLFPLRSVGHARAGSRVLLALGGVGARSETMDAQPDSGDPDGLSEFESANYTFQHPRKERWDYKSLGGEVRLSLQSLHSSLVR